MPSPASQPPDPVQFAPEVLGGLKQLGRAADYARDLECPMWDFAVEIDRLLALGMTTSDLRWLVKRGYLSHARETTAPQDPDRHFDPPEPNLAFARNTCFVLTEAGLAAVDRRCQPDRAVAAMPDSAGHDHAGPVTDAGPRADMGPAKDSQIDLPSRELAARQGRPPAIPNWDRDTRTFLVGAELVKRFRVPSPNQEAVLDAFQEEGWPPSIDDPLSPVPDQQPKRRLHDTIRSLNLNQAKRLIRFRGDGTGQRVFWELL